MFPGAPAQAFAILNLTDVPQQIEVESNEGFKTASIPPWRKYHAVGNGKVRFRGREVYIENHEEFAIWPDGTFGPQQRMRFRKGNML